MTNKDHPSSYKVDGYGIKHGLIAAALHMPYVAVCAESSFFVHRIEHEPIAAALQMLYIQRFVRSRSARLPPKIPHTGLGNLYFFGCAQTRKGLAGTSKVAHQEFAEMETTEFFANDTKGNVAGCPAPKPTAPLLVTALTGDHRRIIIITERQWQNKGSNFPSNDPLHLCGQRHGMGCAPLRSGPHIPMELL